MRIQRKELFTFDKLSDKAKERAREEYRINGLDYEWWDFVFEDAKNMGRIMGIEIDNIYFSGFWSQGDGACFTGRYEYANGSAKKIREEAPQDKDLHRIADSLQELQRKNFYRLWATVKHSGRDSHEYCTEIAVFSREDEGRLVPEGNVAELLRDFMRWIYKNLRTEYEWISSDEQIDESIISNGYEFDENGYRA